MRLQLHTAVNMLVENTALTLPLFGLGDDDTHDRTVTQSHLEPDPISLQSALEAQLGSTADWSLK